MPIPEPVSASPHHDHSKYANFTAIRVKMPASVLGLGPSGSQLFVVAVVVFGGVYFFGIFFWFFFAFWLLFCFWFCFVSNAATALC